MLHSEWVSFQDKKISMAVSLSTESNWLLQNDTAQR